LELSSFQLEEIIHFKPHIGAILNVTPDHLDRYADMEDYFSAKLNLVKNQGPGDYLILNRGDRVLWENANKRPERFGSAGKVWFSANGPNPGVDTWIAQNSLYFKRGNEVETVSLKNNPLRGIHNLENIMASVAAARLAGVPVKDIEKSIPHFKGLAHRMESVGKIGNVEFINDSKATNVDAALKSIGGVSGPMVVILGGKDKGGDFRMLSQSIKERVDKVLLVGKAAKTIRAQLEMDGLREKLADITDFHDAVEQSLLFLGERGGVVLLAPACASFDMFKNFEHRGDVFKEAVLTYKGKKV
jgi:UDP-N-acetylmuramoylalanine--D-glutamate ligase